MGEAGPEPHTLKSGEEVLSIDEFRAREAAFYESVADSRPEPPPFDPDDPQPGQSISAFVPHSGYTSFAYGLTSFDIDPETDCIIAVHG
ncbi:hypothetical protein I6A62_03145 [Frankia sp. AgW1.1]|nr:hypothetical protein [Frankia sp. AgW1.1]